MFEMLSARLAAIRRPHFKVVSFFTAGTPYEEHALRLLTTLRRHRLSFEVDPIEPARYWELNCAKKPSFIRAKLAASDCPVVWLDADATVEQYPDRFHVRGVDFGVHHWDQHHFGSGTLYFGKTDQADALLDAWEQRCLADPVTWDQAHLQAAWDDVAKQGRLTTLMLPRSYLQIFDQPAYEPAVIKHWQASRVEKRSGRAIAPNADGDRVHVTDPRC